MAQVPPLLTPQEVADQFGTSAETVRRWAREKKITAIFYPSGRIKFRQEDVDAALTPQQVSA